MRDVTIVGLLASLLAVCGCDGARSPEPAGNGVCDSPVLQSPLPSVLEETSGVAASRAHAGIFWTHHDSGGDPVVFAIDSTGTVRARVRLTGAANRDWEDIAVGPCEPGGEACLWVAEIGDNSERHSHVAVYRFPEPDPATDTVAAVDIFRFTYPDGPRDAESVYVTDAGVHVVNKGRSDAIDLFRLAPPYDPDGIAELERVQRLAPPPTSVSAQVTAAGADREGRHVVLRTYSGLRFFEVDGDTLRSRGRPADAVAPTQLQGEGVDFLEGERFVLTSEAQGQRPASVAVVVCDPSREPPDTTPSS
jgi:hypothetical protein